MKVYKIQEFANMVGVTAKTLQRWDYTGKLKACRTPSNRRYYTDTQLAFFTNGNNGFSQNNVSKKLVDADMLIQHIAEWQMSEFSAAGAETEYNLLNKVMDCIKNAPAAEVVPTA